jgi:hypothetical protein
MGKSRLRSEMSENKGGGGSACVSALYHPINDEPNREPRSILPDKRFIRVEAIDQASQHRYDTREHFLTRVNTID